MMTPAHQNLLYYGDNLDVLRQHIDDESVDLVYLDPPFNSNADYNVLFKEHDGTAAASQIVAFGDTWRWDEVAAAQYYAIVQEGGDLSRALRAFWEILGATDMMAYLAMMAPRLVELRRVLKPTGSVYLHCDPTASHYLKLLMDAVFGAANFRNEIIWHYYNKFQRGDIHQFAGGHDVIFFYTKTPGDSHTFRSIHEKRDKPVRQLLRKWDGKTKTIKNMKGEDGKVMYREVTERKVDDVWRLPYIVPASKEGLGYPTQKPESILERIIGASTNPGDVVLDPFCGCGTTVSASQRMDRRWIGIDITHLAIGLIRKRLTDAYGTDAHFRVVGEPVSLEDAKRLTEEDKFQFQAWALGLVGARVANSSKKGADRGIDGELVYASGAKQGATERIVFSVKGGHLKADDVRALEGVRAREKAAMGVLITMEEPSKKMRADAASFGMHDTSWGTYQRVQILTVEQLLNGERIKYPAVTGGNVTLKAAKKVAKKAAKQEDLFG